MFANYRRLTLRAGRWSAAIGAMLIAYAASTSEAGFIVGTADGNDSEAEVLAIINDYNASNDPDLPTDIELFKKTDDDSAFVFNLANGFAFYEDALLTMQIFSEAELTALPEAYFTYSGDENLLYYSVKSGPRVSVWTYMAGANHIDIPGFGNEISHVSFWNNSLDPHDVPEPATLVLAGCGLFALLSAGGLRRRS